MSKIASQLISWCGVLSSPPTSHQERTRRELLMSRTHIRVYTNGY